nr:hypothetical protein Iba_scaffold10073CG0690 [Ipomoea batatas]
MKKGYPALFSSIKLQDKLSSTLLVPLTRCDSSHTILIILMNRSCGARAITRATTTRQSGWSTTFASIWMHSMVTNTMAASTMGLQSFSGNGQKETTNAGRLFPTDYPVPVVSVLFAAK